MAKVTEITMSRAVKRNLGNYESTDVFVSMKMVLEMPELEEFETKDYDALRIAVRAAVLDELEHVVHAKPENANITREAIAKRYGL